MSAPVEYAGLRLDGCILSCGERRVLLGIKCARLAHGLLLLAPHLSGTRGPLLAAIYGRYPPADRRKAVLRMVKALRGGLAAVGWPGRIEHRRGAGGGGSLWRLEATKSGPAGSGGPPVPLSASSSNSPASAPVGAGFFSGREA